MCGAWRKGVRGTKISQMITLICGSQQTVERGMEERSILDFILGQMCATLGHNHPAIVASIHKICEGVLTSTETSRSSYRRAFQLAFHPK